ncbi:MAG: HAD domain-containing protein [Fimbriimonas sp.]
MTAIFLDVDGVLNDHQALPNGHNPILPGCIAHLNTILAAVPDAVIVFSSNWRWAFCDRRAVQSLLACHGCFCQGRIHGVTCSDADVCEGPMPEPHEREKHDEMGPIWRALQIERYVREAGVTRYIVLDDLPLKVENLVRTVPHIGLTAEDAARAIAVLNGR